MTHRETILDVLSRLPGPVCDDCLSERTRIRPRQTVNIVCRELEASRGLVPSRSQPCALCGSIKIVNARRGTPASADVVAAPVRSARPARTAAHAHDLWHWEGNLQEALVAWLGADGWTIERTADTAAKTTGKDIVAVRAEERLWVSVKGFPRSTPKTNAATQARHWFSHAIFDMALYRDECSSTRLAIGIPDGFATYQSLADRVRWLRANLPFEIFWVGEDGAVRRT